MSDVEHIETVDAAVIGAGPAGLAAAEMLAAARCAPVVFEAKPSPARKFLMAGKSGLNLTKDEAPERFAEQIACPSLDPILAGFGPREVVAWAEGLGEETFSGSSRRVFPRAMKGSPLLRKWLERLDRDGATLRTCWRWAGWCDAEPDRIGLFFETPDGMRRIAARIVVLALGGASWPRLGSDAFWLGFIGADVPMQPFRPVNMGFDVDWTPVFADRFAGAPVKPVSLLAGGQTVRGEFVVTRSGIEGSAVYALSSRLGRALATGRADLCADLLPDLSESEVAKRLARPRGKASWSSHLRRCLRLEGVRAGLLREAGPLPADMTALARRIKALPIAVTAARPLAEAISSAGGIAWQGLTPELMLKARPGVFAAGEMLDWEAPTGGYLLTACLATGRHAGSAAVRWLQASEPR